MKFSGLFPLRTIPSTQSAKMWSAKKSCHTQSFKMSHTGRDIPMSRVLHPRPEEESLWVDDKSNDDVEKRIVLMPSTWCDCLEGRLPTGAHKLPPLILTCEIPSSPPCVLQPKLWSAVYLIGAALPLSRLGLFWLGGLLWKGAIKRGLSGKALAQWRRWAQ